MIPSMIGVIIAVGTSIGMSKKLIVINTNPIGMIFGIKIKKAVLIFFTKNNKQRYAAIKANKNDFNCVSRMNSLSLEYKTAKPLNFNWIPVLLKILLKSRSINSINNFNSLVFNCGTFKVISNSLP